MNAHRSTVFLTAVYFMMKHFYLPLKLVHNGAHYDLTDISSVFPFSWRSTILLFNLKLSDAIEILSSEGST